MHLLIARSVACLLAGLALTLTCAKVNAQAAADAPASSAMVATEAPAKPSGPPAGFVFIGDPESALVADGTAEPRQVEAGRGNPLARPHEKPQHRDVVLFALGHDGGDLGQRVPGRTGQRVVAARRDHP